MSPKKKQLPWAVGERVTFALDPTDVDYLEVGGTIVSLLAVIKPDVPLYGTVVITTRNTEDLRKENDE